MEKERGFILNFSAKEIREKSMELISGNIRNMPEGFLFDVGIYEYPPKIDEALMHYAKKSDEIATALIGIACHGRSRSIHEMIKEGEVIVIDSLADLPASVRSSQIPNEERNLKYLAPPELPVSIEIAAEPSKNFINGKKLPRKKRRK